MKDDVVKALLYRVTKDLVTDEETEKYRKYFQAMAKYKYDNYQQYSAGLRFIETLAIWLEQFQNITDKKIALEFVVNRLVYISTSEINLIAESCFIDRLQSVLVTITAEKIGVPAYKLTKVLNSKEYNILLRQSLFCGLSDGARLDIFRRANTGILTHEQIYLTYELSTQRVAKMKKELSEDLKQNFGVDCELTPNEGMFKTLFLIDDFSASGTSYLKFDKKLKGKIAGLYENIVTADNDNPAFDLKDLKIYIILYLCTTKAKNMIESNFDKLFETYGHRPELIIMHELDDQYTIKPSEDIFNVCNEDQYYDKGLIEDKHTLTNIKMGFNDCALPLVLEHNTPNNSIPLLWTYDYSKKFKGLFPRIPRHRVI